MRIFIITTIAVLGIFMPRLYSQTSAILEEYIQSGLINNLILQQKELDIQKSILAIRESKSLFYPSVQFEANYTVAAGGRKIDFPIGDLLNPVYGTLNQLTQSQNFPMVENQKIQFLPNNFQETKIKFAYPLYNTDLKYNRQIKELMTMSQTAQKTAYQQELRYSISLAYLQYLQAIEAEKIWGNARNVLLDLRRFNESLVKNNVATREIIADADYQISTTEQEIFDLQSKQSTAKAYFNFLINRTLTSDVQIDSNLLLLPVASYSLEESIKTALASRQELEALQAGQSISNTVIDMNEANRKLPDLYFGGEAGFQGFGYRFNQDQAYVLARVGMTYNLYDGGAKSLKVQTSKIEAQKISNQLEQTRQQIALQVTDRFYQLESAKHALVSAQKAQKAAEDAFKIINNKYRAGQVIALQLTEAHNRVTTAQLQLVLSRLRILQAHESFLQAIK